jgi:hypothetical protein
VALTTTGEATPGLSIFELMPKQQDDGDLGDLIADGTAPNGATTSETATDDGATDGTGVDGNGTGDDADQSVEAGSATAATARTDDGS